MNFKNNTPSIWYNGKIVSWNEAQTHALSHGLNVSGSVFEGIRIYHHQPFYMREHFLRLFNSARLMGFQIPYSLKTLEQAVFGLIHQEKIDTGYIRPIAWVSSQTPAIYCDNDEISVAIIVLHLKSPFTKQEIATGLSLKTSSYIRPAYNMELWQAKASSHYISSLNALREAKAAGYDDALVLDSRGFITETSGSNIFMIKDRVLFTPIPDCFLNGITRQIIIELAKKEEKPVYENHLTLDELLKADEVFLTGTAYELMAVRKIDHVDFHPGKMTAYLRKAFVKLTKQCIRT